jgi:MFS family permease
VSQVRERSEQRRNPFLEVLARPGAIRFSAAGFIGRMPMSMFGLGTVLLIAAMTGRYGLAGIVAGAGSVGYALCAPQAARLADRFGQGRVLRPQTVFFAATTLALIACAERRAPVWALLVTGALAGASMPSLGSMVRARWSALLGDSPLLHSAFSLESVADEVIFVIGPALVTLLATEVYPAAGVAVAMVACVIGTLLLASQRVTEPSSGRGTPAPSPPAAGPSPSAPAPSPSAPAPSPSAAAPSPSAAAPSQPAPARRFQIPAPGLITLAPVYFFMGAMFATIDLSTVDFAQEHGHKPLAGFILGTYALGSAVGGLWYGSRIWHAPVRRRFPVTLCIVAAGTVTFWAVPGLIVLDLVIFCSGLAISPTFIAGFSLIDQQAAAARRTEGLTWLTSAISVGVAAGSSVAGHLLDLGGARWGYGFAAVCGAAAVTACLLGLGKLRVAAAPPAPAEPAQWGDAET